MTRVWSLSRADDTNESQLFFVYKNESKLLSFDSGYDSSLNSVNDDVNQTLEFDENFNEFQELNHFSDANEENRYQESEETAIRTTISTTRVQSSPIPIPQNRRHKKSSINHSRSSLSTHSSHSYIASSTLSLQSLDSVHCLIGHPPYECGCIRGYRHPFLTSNSIQTLQSSTDSGNNSLSLSLSCNNQRESADTGAKKRCYPLPDIISSSQNRSLMNEIIREIGSDLRRIGKDFIATRNQKIGSPKIAAITRLMKDTIPYILNQFLQLF